MRSLRTKLLTPALLAALAFGACKKDEPKPEPAPEPAAAETETPKVDPAPKEPAEVAKAVDPAPAPSAAPTPSAAGFIDRPALTTTSVEAIPELVVGFGATSSLKQLVTEVARLQPSLGDDPFGTILSLAQRGTGLGDLAKIAWDKPLYVVIPSPVVFEDGFVWVAHVEEGFDLKATFPDGQEAGDLFKVELGLQTLHIDVKDKVLRVASHAELLEQLKEFTLAGLVGWTPGQLLHLEASVENTMKAYAKELGEMKELMPLLAQQLEEDGVNAGQLAMLAEAANEGFALLEGTRRASLVVDPSSDSPRFTFTAQFIPGTSGAEFIAKTSGKRVPFAGDIPAEAWLTFAGHWPGSEPNLEESIKLLLDNQSEYLTWTEAEARAAAEKMVALQKVTGDDHAFWARTVGDQLLTLEAISSSSDSAAYKRLSLEIVDLVIEKVWAGLKGALAEEMGPAGQGMTGSFKEAWASLSGLVKPFGIDISTKDDPTVSGVRIAFDWNKLPIQEAGPEAALVKGFFGDVWEIGVAAKGERVAAVFGANGLARSEALVSGGAPASSDPWLRRAAERSWGVMTLKPARLLGLLAGYPSFAAYAEPMRAFPAVPVVVEGIADKEQLRIEIELPLETLRAVGAITR